MIVKRLPCCIYPANRTVIRVFHQYVCFPQITFSCLSIKTSLHSFKRKVYLLEQRSLQHRYPLFSFLLLWAGAWWSVLHLLPNSVHFRPWGGQLLSAGNIRDLLTRAHAQQPTGWPLFSPPATNQHWTMSRLLHVVATVERISKVIKYFFWFATCSNH